MRGLHERQLRRVRKLRRYAEVRRAGLVATGVRAAALPQHGRVSAAGGWRATTHAFSRGRGENLRAAAGSAAWFREPVGWRRRHTRWLVRASPRPSYTPSLCWTPLPCRAPLLGSPRPRHGDRAAPLDPRTRAPASFPAATLCSRLPARILSRDSYFFHSSGKRFRSRTEVARWLGLDAAPPPKQKKMKIAHSAASATMAGVVPSGAARPTGTAVVARAVKTPPPTAVVLDAVVVGPAYAL